MSTGGINQGLARQIGFGEDELKMGRLRRAMEFSMRKLRPFRERRMQRLRQFVGFNYSDDGSEDRQPINMMQLALNVYTRKLAPSTPRSDVSTVHKELRPRAFELQLALDHTFREINLARAFRECVQEALVGMGILKVGVTVQDLGEIGGFLHDPGQIFADVVPLDDWIHDMTAKKIEAAAFMGDHYRMPYDALLESGWVDPDMLRDIGPSGNMMRGIDDADRSETLSQGSVAMSEEFEDYIDLWDVWLPRQNLVLVLPFDHEGPPIKTIEWEGPETGPYHHLAFEHVPSSVLPLPPAAHWQDMNELVNRLFVKLGRQAERQKTLLGVPDTAVADGEHIISAEDGQAIRMTNPGACQEFRTGGVDQTNLAFVIALKDLISYRAGNLDALAGLGPQADTLGQEEIVAESSSEMLSDMREQCNGFYTNVCRSIAHHLWYDPLVNIPLLNKSSEGGPSFEFMWGNDSKEGDFLDYNVQINIFGTREQTPAQRVQSITNILNTVIGPLMPMMMQQGIVIDMEALIKLIAKNTGLSELNQLMIYMAGEQQTQSGPVQPHAPANTTRTNVRVNRPGMSRQGFDQTMIATLLGQGLQKSQAQAVGRPVS